MGHGSLGGPQNWTLAGGPAPGIGHGVLPKRNSGTLADHPAPRIGHGESFENRENGTWGSSEFKNGTSRTDTGTWGYFRNCHFIFYPLFQFRASVAKRAQCFIVVPK